MAKPKTSSLHPAPTKQGAPLPEPDSGANAYLDPYETTPNAPLYVQPATATGGNMKTPGNEAAAEQVKNTPRPQGGNASKGNINPDAPKTKIVGLKGGS